MIKQIVTRGFNSAVKWIVTHGFGFGAPATGMDRPCATLTERAAPVATLTARAAPVAVFTERGCNG